MTLHAARITQALRRLDAWRASANAAPTAQGTYKEWQHFCVRLPDAAHAYLVINLNLAERGLPSGVERSARVITLVRLARWHGHVEAVPDDQVQTDIGELDTRFGATSLRLRAGALQLDVLSGEIEASLTLRPAMLPSGTTRQALGNGHALHWVAVPRLYADGTVCVAGHPMTLSGAMAYHDHNWGQFRWGADLTWEWGFVHPSDDACPWTIVFARVSDRMRHRTLNQFVLVWKGDTHVRAFQDHELTVELLGLTSGPRPFTIPGGLAMLSPGAAAGVPAGVRIRGTCLTDTIVIEYRTGAIARIAIPSDADDFGTVLLNETEGRAYASGQVVGEHFRFEGTAMLELVRA